MNIFNLEDNLLISCPGELGGILYLEGENEVVISSRPSTGICLGETSLVWAHQDDGGRHLLEAKNSSAKLIEISSSPLDIHDVLLQGNKIYLAITNSNEVVELDCNYQRIESWQLSGEDDSAHLNSIAIYKGQLIASIFGRFTKHRQYKNGTLGLGQIINVRTGETIVNGLSQPHSLTVENNLLYFCSSEEKKLHVYDGSNIVQTVSLPGYARGIAIGKKHIYVGISMSRNVEDEQYPLNSGGLSVINKETMEYIGTRALAFKEVYDIKVVTRYANLLGLISTQDTQIKMLKETLAMRDLSLSRQMEDVSRLNNELAAVYSSLSWKATKPLRSIRSIVNAKRG